MDGPGNWSDGPWSWGGSAQAESLHPAGHCNALRELGVVGWLADAHERRPRDGLSYTVSTARSSVKFDIRLGREGGLNVQG
jgi:hypothetical protein